MRRRRSSKGMGCVAMGLVMFFVVPIVIVLALTAFSLFMQLWQWLSLPFAGIAAATLWFSESARQAIRRKLPGLGGLWGSDEQSRLRMAAAALVVVLPTTAVAAAWSNTISSPSERAAVTTSTTPNIAATVEVAIAATQDARAGQVAAVAATATAAPATTVAVAPTPTTPPTSSPAGLGIATAVRSGPTAVVATDVAPTPTRRPLPTQVPPTQVPPTRVPPSPTAPPPTALPPTATPQQDPVVSPKNAATIAMFAGPGTEYTVVDNFSGNTSARVIARSQSLSWVQINNGRTTAWVPLSALVLAGVLERTPIVAVPAFAAPAAPPTQVPAGGSGVRYGAVCGDGSTSSATGSGACSHHGGVAYWLTR